jgi:hypothetical protein
MAECEHGDPRPGRCALCRQRVRVQTAPHRYADTSPLPPKRRKRKPSGRVTAAAVARRDVSVWCAPCSSYVMLGGNVYQDRSDAPVHVTPSEWTEHRQEHQR